MKVNGIIGKRCKVMKLKTWEREIILDGWFIL